MALGSPRFRSAIRGPLNRMTGTVPQEQHPVKRANQHGLGVRPRLIFPCHFVILPVCMAEKGQDGREMHMEARRAVALVVGIVVGTAVGLAVQYLLTGDASVAPVAGAATFLVVFLAWKKRT